MAPPGLQSNHKTGMYMEETYTAEPIQIVGKTSNYQDIHEKSQNLSQIGKDVLPKRSYEIVWRNVMIFGILHLLGLYGMYCLFLKCQWKTVLWGLFVAVLGSKGVTCGAHRLWAHRTYKAKLPLRILLCYLQTTALQNHIYEWCRDHRVHHKFTDTDADPHNSKRGFFFCHMGWLLVKKHKDVIAKGKCVDLSDLEQDSVVRFQRKYYWLLAPLCCFVIPSFVPCYFWGEPVFQTFCSAGVFRYLVTLHLTWCINSVAHLYGTKPYDKNIMAVEASVINYVAFGEQWHNYHHVFPWDYKAAELPYKFNLSTAFIDLFYSIGWAYDLKTTSLDMIKKRVKRTGDGTWRYQNLLKYVEDQKIDPKNEDGSNCWGWGDQDMNDSIKRFVENNNPQ